MGDYIKRENAIKAVCGDCDAYPDTCSEMFCPKRYARHGIEKIPGAAALIKITFTDDTDDDGGECET